MVGGFGSRPSGLCCVIASLLERDSVSHPASKAMLKAYFTVPV